VFCPNCGTQNPEAAQTCSKCGFHLKSVAAPKFKGTMLMMNQSNTPVPPAPTGRVGSSAPPPGAPPQRASSVPPPPGAPSPAIPSKLKGTMVGVAPMAVAVRGPSPVAVPPAGAPYFVPPGGPTPLAATPPTGEGGSAFSPPVPQAGVNPLGGTLAAESPAFPAYGQPGAAAPYGGAPAGRVAPGTQLMPGVGGAAAANLPYGPPAGVGLPGLPAPAIPSPAPPYDEPPSPANAYGARPANAFGAPPPANAFGSPLPANAFGAPPGYGAPVQQSAFMPPAAAAPLAPYPGEAAPLSVGASAFVLKKRNALLTWLLPLLVTFFGMIVIGSSLLLGSALVAAAGSLLMLGGGIWWLLLAIGMANELKAVTRSEEFGWWPIFVPFYSIYWSWILVPQEVAKAKQLRGVSRPPQSIVLYILLWHFALATDLNDMA